MESPQVPVVHMPDNDPSGPERFYVGDDDGAGLGLSPREHRALDRALDQAPQGKLTRGT